MRDRSGPTGLGDGPPIGGLGLNLIVGRVGGGGREGITRFKYENGKMIIFYPDIKAVIQTIQILNHDLDVEVIDDEDIS